jgi:hypothetical protein
MTSFQMDVANLCFSGAAVVVMVSGAMTFSTMTLSNTKLNTSNKTRLVWISLFITNAMLSAAIWPLRRLT